MSKQLDLAYEQLEKVCEKFHRTVEVAIDNAQKCVKDFKTYQKANVK